MNKRPSSKAGPLGRSLKLLDTNLIYRELQPGVPTAGGGIGFLQAAAAREKPISSKPSEDPQSQTPAVVPITNASQAQQAQRVLTGEETLGESDAKGLIDKLAGRARGPIRDIQQRFGLRPSTEVERHGLYGNPVGTASSYGGLHRGGTVTNTSSARSSATPLDPDELGAIPEGELPIPNDHPYNLVQNEMRESLAEPRVPTNIGNINELLEAQKNRARIVAGRQGIQDSGRIALRNQQLDAKRVQLPETEESPPIVETQAAPVPSETEAAAVAPSAETSVGVESGVGTALEDLAEDAVLV